MKANSVLRIINLGFVPFHESQSVYHAVAACMTEATPDTIIICIPAQPYYCLGYHQGYRQAIDRQAHQRSGYPVMRRRLGGGMTYLDSDQLFYQCVFHRSRSPAVPAKAYQMKLDAPIRVLRRINLQAELVHTNEIEVGGKRIAGTGGGLIGQANVVVGNFLRDFQFESMAKIINAPCQEFRGLALQMMRERITTLRASNCDSYWDQMPELLIEEYRRTLGRQTILDDLTAEEKDKSAALAELMTSQKYLEAQDPRDSASTCLTRLKISGSTYIELTVLESNRYGQFAILVKRNEKTQQAVMVENLRENLQSIDILKKLRVISKDELPVDCSETNKFLQYWNSNL